MGIASTSGIAQLKCLAIEVYTARGSSYSFATVLLALRCQVNPEIVQLSTEQQYPDVGCKAKAPVQFVRISTYPSRQTRATTLASSLPVCPYTMGTAAATLGLDSSGLAAPRCNLCSSCGTVPKNDRYLVTIRPHVFYRCLLPRGMPFIKSAGEYLSFFPGYPVSIISLFVGNSSVMRVELTYGVSG